MFGLPATVSVIFFTVSLCVAPHALAQTFESAPNQPVTPPRVVSPPETLATPGEPAPADAFPPPVPLTTHFAEKGHFFVAGASNIAFNLTWTQNADTRYMLNIAPSIGYFFTPQIFGRLGLDVVYEHPPVSIMAAGGATSSLNLALVPGVGIALPMSHWVTFAPWIGVGFGQTFDAHGVNDAHRSKIDVQLNTPFVLDLIEHFSVSFGPYYKQHVVNKLTVASTSTNLPKQGDFGAALGVIAYW